MYVKFNPQSLEEEKLLQEDSTIIVSDYPLDYDYSTAELEQMGYAKTGRSDFIIFINGFENRSSYLTHNKSVLTVL